MSGDWGAKRATRYDARVRELFPDYEELHDRTDALVGSLVAPGGSVLVVGAGTGYEAGRLARFGYTVTGVDPSAEMLALAPSGPGLSYFTGFVSDLPEQATFDAATCLLVMHFLPEAEKLELLQSISARVKSGGLLVLADAAGDYSDPEFKAAMAEWERSLATRSTPEQLERDLAGIRDKVHFLPLQRIQELFREAGWEPELLWRPGILSLWSATRSAEAASAQA